MAGGIDKLTLLSSSIEADFLTLAREEGFPTYGYRHVLDLRQTRHKLPAILYCDGRHNGIHKVDLVGVADLGLQRTLQTLKRILGHLSVARIYRIDFCADIPGIGVWDLAETALVSRTQNFRLYRRGSGTSFYLRNSADKTILIYDKAKQLAAKGGLTFRPGEQLTRIEVQLKGRAVPFRKIRHIDRYADVDLLKGVQLRELRSLRKDAKPLHFLAAGRLRELIHKYGLQGVKKQFSPSRWAYIENTLFRTLQGDEIPDLGLRLRRSIEDWLEGRIRFPRSLRSGESL